MKRDLDEVDDELIIDLRAVQMQRVCVDGRHLSLGQQPFHVRGVTYGSFVARADGHLFPETQRVRDDFATMAALGLNTVRTYTLPPQDVLEIAEAAGVRLMVGLHHHDWRMEAQPGRAARRRVLDAGRRAVDEAIEICAGNPTVLALAVGNEVPSEVVRVHGIPAVEDTLSTLVNAVHVGDPALLVTYVSYPTTEYLEVDGLDVVAFNVFLEEPDRMAAYLRHLHTVAGERPVIVSELGLASGVHGDHAQAVALDWQLRMVDESGCVGATVFSWTDEWSVADRPVTGWGFGITDENRQPKPASVVVRGWAARSVADLRESWPRMTVVVCAYNEERVLDECLDSLVACPYPDLEVIVCDDGSTDATAAIAERYPFRLLRLPHGGLSRARNAGCDAATGEIVAYLDADAQCHPEWPFRLALSLEQPGLVATGGPNLPVKGAPFVERAVAASPGGPVEVLTGDDRAEHVPGCNMAFERDALLAIGGFDEVYTSAGDDVDICWRLLDAGGAIGFAATAQVRHHRRGSVRAYLRQQRNYGRSERVVATRHRHRFNRLGQARWRGFLYGGVRVLPRVLRPIIYHGYQGHAPFQPVQQRRSEQAMGWTAALLPLVVLLLLLGLIVGIFAPVGLLVAAAALALVTGYAVAVYAAYRPPRNEPAPRRMRALVTWLHVAQPVVRAWGRLRPARLEPAAVVPPAPWQGDRAAWLRDIERTLRSLGLGVRVGGPTDGWDLDASRFGLVRWRVTTAVVWAWTPVHRLSVRLHPSAVLVAAAAGALAISFGPAPVVAVVGAVAIDALVGRRRTTLAIASTTAGAAAPPLAAHDAGGDDERELCDKAS